MSTNNLNFNILYDHLVNLARILHQENMLLVKNKIQKIMQMQQQKNLILDEVSKLRKEINGFGEQDMNDNIKKIIDEINNLSQFNLKITEKAMRVNEKIMRLIIQDPQIKFYGPQGLIIEDSAPIALKDLI